MAERASRPKTVDRYLALKREKERLRHERDRLLLDLAAGMSEDRMALLLEVEAHQLSKLVCGARERVQSSDPRFVPDLQTPVRARRLLPLHEVVPAAASAPRVRPRRSGDAARAQGAHRADLASAAYADVDAYYGALGARSLEHDH